MDRNIALFGNVMDIVINVFFFSFFFGLRKIFRISQQRAKFFRLRITSTNELLGGDCFMHVKMTINNSSQATRYCIQILRVFSFGQKNFKSKEEIASKIVIFKKITKEI